MMHAIYGYRYLVFCVLALLAFDRRQVTGNPRWMLASGFATGLAFSFRYDPASALVVALVIAVLASDRSPRVWLRDARYAAGGLIVRCRC
jgi:4-amino-4-deoxy-L-arabinose transferase-like glycosyltransferase